jgi:hypothetical protein
MGSYSNLDFIISEVDAELPFALWKISSTRQCTFQRYVTSKCLLFAADIQIWEFQKLQNNLGIILKVQGKV